VLKEKPDTKYQVIENAMGTNITNITKKEYKALKVVQENLKAQCKF
jgi:hypothetical protein